jgi:hypothetical protein
MGTARSCWPSAKHCGSWLGLAAQNLQRSQSAARRGVAKATTATAYRERVVRQVKRKAASLGLLVVERDAGAQPS